MGRLTWKPSELAARAAPAPARHPWADSAKCALTSCLSLRQRQLPSGAVHGRKYLNSQPFLGGIDTLVYWRQTTRVALPTRILHRPQYTAKSLLSCVATTHCAPPLTFRHASSRVILSVVTKVDTRNNAANRLASFSHTRAQCAYHRLLHVGASARI